MPASPDPTSLTDDVIINVGGWDPRYARVVMIAVDDDVAIALVDGNGDGAELEMEYWFRKDGRWEGGSTSGDGPLDSLSTTRWDAGSMVCAVGRTVPGEVVRIGYEGTVHECQANQYGVWGFIRKVEDVDAKHPLPEILDEDAETAETRRQTEERAEVSRQRVRARINEMRRPPAESPTSDE
jgi:hypothetical protein